MGMKLEEKFKKFKESFEKNEVVDVWTRDIWIVVFLSNFYVHFLFPSIEFHPWSQFYNFFKIGK
jgi:hypothetical protein